MLCSAKVDFFCVPKQVAAHDLHHIILSLLLMRPPLIFPPRFALFMAEKALVMNVAILQVRPPRPPGL